MTTKELYDGLCSLGYPVAYSHFAEGDVPKPPFIVYSYQGSDNFAADGIVYCEIEDIDIELYTKRKNLEAERKIADYLLKNGIFYEKQEYYIESEKMIQVIFEVEVRQGQEITK